MNLNKLYKGISIALIAAAIFSIGNYIGGRSVVSGVTATGSIINIEGIPVTADQLAPFWKAWKVLNNKYVEHDATSTPSKRVYGAIKGLAESYGDPYTVFFDPEETKAFKGDISGNFEGVGMEIGLKDNNIVVVSPLKGSPAEKAGMLTGDRIVKIDDTLTSGFSVEKAVKNIRGPKGTVVKLTVIREGEKEPLVISITRSVINMPTIDTETYDKSDNVHQAISGKDSGTFGAEDVRVIRLYSFNANSPQQFRSAVQDFIRSGSKKLIIDLRGNPGGYLDAAIYMASFFLPSDAIVVSEDFGDSRPTKVYKSIGYNTIGRDVRVAILVNGGTASASEILAGALQDHGVAKLIGTKTFGKGSVQEVIPITSDTALKVTIARWLTPNGKNISKQGIDPDIEVKLTPDDQKKDKDPQMQRALDYLRQLR